MNPASYPSLHAIAPNTSTEYAYPSTFTPEPRPSVPVRNQHTTPPVYNRARHPEYTDKNDRFITFTRWTFSHVQDPTKLVNYGFFYTGQVDLVRCYFCGLGLKDFISSDDPLLEHVRYSEGCEFLVQLLGPSRLREIKESLQSETRTLYSNATSHRRSENSTSTNSGQGQSHTQSSTALEEGRAQRYRNPKYSEYAIRLGSYSGWPRHVVQTPEKLAEAGFYYTGVRDVVRCFACDGGLQKWDPTDDPWIEHCVNFPFCVYLKQTKGDDYIKLAKAHCHNQPQPISIVETTENGPQGIAEELTELHIGEEAETATNLDALIQQVNDMGFKRSEISDAIKSLQNDKSEITVEKVIDEIQRSETDRDKQKVSVPKAVKPSPRETQKAATKEITEGLKPIKEGIEQLPQAISFPAFPSIKAEKSDGLTDEELEEIIWFRDQKEKESDPLLLIGPEATKQLRRFTNKDDADTTYGIYDKKELFQERQRLLEQLYCNMCKTADINSLFLPCQHHRFCTACSDSLTQCPICGRQIQHKIKTYRP